MINLTTPFSISGSITESDTIGACTYMVVDYRAQTVTFEFRQGVLASGNITAGNYSPVITMTVSLVTGAWTTSSGQSGTIGAGALASFNSQIKSDRNLVETFAAGGSGILPGSQVAWT